MQEETQQQVRQLRDVELLHAQHLKHSFPKHTHERYAIGVIEQGALGFFYRGENVVAAQGQINLCIPGEVHTGQPATEGGWTYRMFYFDADVLQTVASDVLGRACELPFFRSGVLHDPALAAQLYQLHQQLGNVATPLLEQQTRLLETLGELIVRHGDDSSLNNRPKIPTHPTAVQQLIHYIEENFSADISLDDLAQHTHISRYHLVHLFSETVGIPPHAYLRQVRIRRAKQMLHAGQPIATVAAATGFTDQSHLNRWFKRLWGFTPGQYRNSVQDGHAIVSYPSAKSKEQLHVANQTHGSLASDI